MAELLVRFTEAIQGSDGRRYRPEAWGERGADGLWRGWLEFSAADRCIRTDRDTTQPNRTDLVYWAEGLTHTFLDGALLRALRDDRTPRRPVRFGETLAHAIADMPHAVLDPFAVYVEGEDILRDQLMALSPDQLASISAAYGLGVELSASADITVKRRDVDAMVARVRALSGQTVSRDPGFEEGARDR